MHRDNVAALDLAFDIEPGPLEEALDDGIQRGLGHAGNAALSARVAAMHWAAGEAGNEIQCNTKATKCTRSFTKKGTNALRAKRKNLLSVQHRAHFAISVSNLLHLPRQFARPLR